MAVVQVSSSSVDAGAEPEVRAMSITGQVTAGLTHNPDRGTLGLFAAGGAEDKVVLEGREGGSVGHGEETWRVVWWWLCEREREKRRVKVGTK
jgi:hypothetical protein